MSGDDPQRGGNETTEPIFAIDEARRPRTRIVRLTGVLDETVAPGLRRLADDVLSSTPRFVLLDLSTVSAVTSAGVRTLVHIAENAGRDDIGLGLVAGEEVRAAFVTEQVHELFELYDSLDDALDAL